MYVVIELMKYVTIIGGLIYFASSGGSRQASADDKPKKDWKPFVVYSVVICFIKSKKSDKFLCIMCVWLCASLNKHLLINESFICKTRYKRYW